MGVARDLNDHTVLYQAINQMVQTNAPDVSGFQRKQSYMDETLDAVISNSKKQLLDARSDPYADLTMIDTGASTGYVHNATRSSISNSGMSDLSGFTKIGDLTSNGGLAAAFNGTTNEGKASCAAKLGAQSQCFIGIDFGPSGPPETITEINVYPSSDVGLTDASHLEQFYIRSHSSAPSGGGEGTAQSADLFPSTTPDQTGVVNITGLNIAPGAANRYVWAVFRPAGNNTCYVAEMQFNPNSGSDDIDLRSTQFTATAVPTSGFYLGLVEPAAAITYGVDFLVDISRTGGSEWEALTLEKLTETEILVESNPLTVDVAWGTVDFTGTSGQDGKSRIRTANTSEVELFASTFGMEG